MKLAGRWFWQMNRLLMWNKIGFLPLSWLAREFAAPPTPEIFLVLLQLFYSDGLYSAPLWWSEFLRCFLPNQNAADCAGHPDLQKLLHRFFLLRSSVLYGSSVFDRSFPWNMHLCLISLKNQRGRHHNSFFRYGIPMQAKPCPFPGCSIPQIFRVISLLLKSLYIPL